MNFLRTKDISLIAMIALISVSCSTSNERSRSLASSHQEKYGFERCAIDVKKQIESLSEKYTDKYLFKSQKFFPFGDYKMSPFNKFGIDNHFQGVVRIGDREEFVVSGADNNKKLGHLFLLKRDSKRVVGKITPEKGTYWHLGGLDASGGMVVVPAEAYKTGDGQEVKSKLLFFDFTDFNNPRKLDYELLNKKSAFMPLAGIQKLPNGKFLVLVRKGQQNIYFSKTESLEDGLIEKEDRPSVNFGGGNTIAIIPQCDGKLFVAGFDNTERLAPLKAGINWLTVRELDFGNNEDGDINFYENYKPKTREVLKKKFVCNRFCNFNAGGSIVVNPDHSLEMIVTPHFRTYIRGRMRLMKFTHPSMNSLNLNQE